MGHFLEIRCGSKLQTPENRKPPLYFNHRGIVVRDLEDMEVLLVSGGAVDSTYKPFMLDYSHVVRSSPVCLSLFFFFFHIYTGW